MAVNTAERMSEQIERMGRGSGFIAALDQSGGSTPKALQLYGVDDSAYSSDDEMFDTVHAMRTRIMTDLRFTGTHVLGAILFQNTLDREVLGQPTSQYLWREKQIVPFLKVDYGMDDVADAVVFLASEESSFFNGADFDLDGGISAGTPLPGDIPGAPRK
jgi:fructose-bisphosphate aldolase class I